MSRRLGRGLGSVVGPLVEALVVVWVLASLVFLALRLLPGDPAALLLGDDSSEFERAAIRAKLHLNESLPAQYVRYLGGLASLNLGESLRRPGESATSRVLASFAPTGRLALLAVLLGSFFGNAMAVLGAGPWLGRRRVWVDRVATAVAATPLLAFAPALTLALAVRLRVLPLPGDPDAGVLGLVFASALLSIPLSAHVARVARAALTDLGKSQFLTVARAKGAGPARVMVLHALPAASGPIVTVIGAQLGALLGGAVVLERLFERPGLGSLIMEAYASRDLPVLEGAVVLSGALFVFAQKGAVALQAAVDPRARSGG